MPCRICPGCEGPYPGPARSGIVVQTEDAMRADKRYYLNADRSKVVEQDDPDAAYLLAAEGDDITNEDVKRYGLGSKKQSDPVPAVVHSIAADPPQDDDEPEDGEKAPAEAKAQRPVEDKAVKPSAAKKDDGK
jgi:hypothetical protein